MREHPSFVTHDKMNNNKNKKEKVKNICPNCGSKNVIKWTKRKTQNRGLIQGYKCKDCGKTFTIDDGFFRMRNHPKKITCAMDLFYRGVSTRKVQEHFKAFYPHNSSHKSAYKWVVKYAKMISNFTDTLKDQIHRLRKTPFSFISNPISLTGRLLCFNKTAFLLW